MAVIKKVFFRAALALVLVGVFFIGYNFLFPDVAKLKRWHPPRTSFMEYRLQEWERQGKKKKIIQNWVNLSQISPFAIKAVLIAEDDKFWSHEGFDFAALQKALLLDIKKKRFKSGGSTISQQLVKNLYLSPEKSLLRKLREAIITWRIERTLSKKRIIELYLNAAEWGNGIFGIEAAARHYYGKPAAALTAWEAARLAAVLPNPRRYQPTGAAGYVEKRSGIIYRVMVKRGIVIPEYEEVMSEPRDDNQMEQLEKPALTPEAQPDRDGGLPETRGEEPGGASS